MCLRQERRGEGDSIVHQWKLVGSKKGTHQGKGGHLVRCRLRLGRSGSPSFLRKEDRVRGRGIWTFTRKSFDKICGQRSRTRIQTDNPLDLGIFGRNERSMNSGLSLRRRDMVKEKLSLHMSFVHRTTDSVPFKSHLQPGMLVVEVRTTTTVRISRPNQFRFQWTEGNGTTHD